MKKHDSSQYYVRNPSEGPERKQVVVFVETTKKNI